MCIKYVCVPVVIEEQGVRLKLTVTDTPGFGDQINNEKWFVLLLSCPNREILRERERERERDLAVLHKLHHQFEVSVTA